MAAGQDGVVARFESELAAHLGCPVRVTFGRARTSPVRAVRDDAGMRVRLHAFFREAAPDVRDDLARWLRAGRRARAASHRLDRWIDARLEALPKPAPRRVTLAPRGAHHDLDAFAADLLAAELAADYADGRPPPGVTWGARRKSRARRSLLLGTYAPESRVVRVHPVLDRADVPAWFVRFVLFHELLHDAVPAVRDTAGRVRHHHRGFRARERAYPDFARARAWERRHLPRLLRLARRG